MNKKLRDLFQQPFDLEAYRKVILSQLLHAQRLLTTPEPLEQYDNGDQLYGLGYLTDYKDKEIGLYYTHVHSGDVRRKRVGFRKMLHPYVNNKYGAEAAIAVFDDGEHWRLSYICDLKGGITSAKRFSYVFGDPKGQYNTPVTRLTDLAQKRLTLDELHKTFSVDALSKEFFDEYHRHYDRIIAELSRQGNKGAVFHDYVKKMMGRIVFLHFLQKKGWLNGDPEFLKNLFSKQPLDRKEDFLEQVLEPLFFGIFNTEPDKRKQLFQQENWDLRWLEEWKRLPYLNGGLFERDEVDKMKIKLPASLFENLFDFMASYNFTVDENDPDDADIGIDPEMLGKIFESLLEDNKAKGAFYTPKEIVRYMCKESLIAYLDSKIVTDNASEKQNAQSANNPIQESKQLSQCGGADTKDQCVPGVRDLKQSIRDFVEQHEFPEELEPYRTTLDTALQEVKICDPAIGSGAFPMGLLNELWRCREAMEDIDRAALPSPLERGTAKPGGMFEVDNKRAALKREIIENNIYGVDIEKGAIDIARLRFWLSIVVDAEKPEPLPNFDYKFMQGNSLIESFDDHDLSHIMDSSSPLERGAAKRRGMSKAGWAENQTGIEFGSEEVKQNLRNWLKMYFSLTDHKEKAYYRELINSSVKNYIVQQGIGPAAETRLNAIDPSANQDFFLWHTWFKDIFDNGGFDIVIGNPPYGAKYSEKCKQYYKNNYISTKTITGKQKGSLDTFTLFIEHGYNILKKDGNLAFIVPIALTSSDSLSGIHRILLENCDNIRISSYAVRPKPVFERAVVNTSILLFTKSETKCQHLYSTKMHRRNEDKFNLQYLVEHLQFTDVKYYLLYGRIPKIGTEIEKRILNKVFNCRKLVYYYDCKGAPIYFRTTGGRYFKVVTNYPTGSTKEKPLFFDKRAANSIGCVLSSNLSFWFYQIYSNNLDWKTYEIENFTLPILSDNNINNLNNLYKKYLDDIEINANVRLSTGESKYLVDSFKEYKIVRSKAIIDEIDDYIGPLYGLTQEEIDFVKNYELEFRMAGE